MKLYIAFLFCFVTGGLFVVHQKKELEIMEYQRTCSMCLTDMDCCLWWGGTINYCKQGGYQPAQEGGY
mgnify:CR=1 FL=1